MDPLDPTEPPPNDKLAERVVLCGLLREYTLVWRGLARVGMRRDDLYWHHHRLLWDSIRASGAVLPGVGCVAWDVWRHLGRAGHWREWGGRDECAAWLVRLLDEDPTGFLAERNAVVVRRLALLRGKLTRARELACEVWAEARTIRDLGALAVK